MLVSWAMIKYSHPSLTKSWKVWNRNSNSSKRPPLCQTLQIDLGGRKTKTWMSMWKATIYLYSHRLLAQTCRVELMARKLEDIVVHVQWAITTQTWAMFTAKSQEIAVLARHNSTTKEGVSTKTITSIKNFLIKTCSTIWVKLLTTKAQNQH